MCRSCVKSVSISFNIYRQKRVPTLSIKQECLGAIGCSMFLNFPYSKEDKRIGDATCQSEYDNEFVEVMDQKQTFSFNQLISNNNQSLNSFKYCFRLLEAHIFLKAF